MAKGSKGRRSRQCRLAPYPLPSCNHDHDVSENLHMEKSSNGLDQKEWEDVTCSVCMECPHNAVLLLCSSHDKGCRPYMCGTSFRYSNCLDQYKKAYAKASPPTGTSENPILVPDYGWPVDKCEVTELACPLCRGQVKGWTVVDPARDYLNLKKRCCMQDDCSYVGTYRELRKHMRAAHPSARPRKVDPVLEQKWRRIEREREHDDVISTIRSTMPGAMVFGDYVIEGGNYGFDSDEENEGFDADAAERNGGMDVGFDRNLVNVFLLLHAFGPSRDGLGGQLRLPERSNRWAADESTVGVAASVDGLNSSDDEISDNDNRDGGGLSLVSRLRRHHNRVLLGRSGRRRRRREQASGGQR